MDNGDTPELGIMYGIADSVGSLEQKKERMNQDSNHVNCIFMRATSLKSTSARAHTYLDLLKEMHSAFDKLITAKHSFETVKMLQLFGFLNWAWDAMEAPVEEPKYQQIQALRKMVKESKVKVLDPRDRALKQIQLHSICIGENRPVTHFSLSSFGRNFSDFMGPCYGCIHILSSST